MTRDLAAGVETAVQERVIRPAVFVYLNFASGPVRLWSGIGEIDWNGDTYAGAGTLGSIGTIEETQTLRATGLTFALSGIPSAMISLVLLEHYQGRRAQAWLAFFDAAWQLINDPVPVFAGRMDTSEIEDGGQTATVKINAENRLIDLKRVNAVRFYTHADQQALHPGDRGLEYVEALQEQELPWGRTSLGRGNAPDSGGGAGGTAPSPPPFVPPPEGDVSDAADDAAPDPGPADDGGIDI